MSSVAYPRRSNLSAIAAPTVAMGRRCCDATLPLTSTESCGGKSVSGGDTATANEIMAPAAMITQLGTSSRFACIQLEPSAPFVASE